MHPLLKRIIYIHSRHFIKDGNVQCSVSCQITNMKKSCFRCVFKINFPEFMTCGTFKSTPFKKKKKEKNVGGESLEAETRWVRMA